MRRNIGSLVVLAAGATFLVACGGSKVVVVPPSTPVVAGTPVAPCFCSCGYRTGYSSSADDYGGGKRESRYAWVRSPSSGSMWVPGHWQPTSGGYIWVPGSWR
jgi:hypothetical protein